MVELPDRPGPRLDRIDAEKDALDLLIKHLRLGRRDNAVSLAQEEAEAAFAFEQQDELAHRWLRQPEPFRGAGEAAQFHDRLEGFDLADIHAHGASPRSGLSAAGPGSPETWSAK